MLGEKIWIMGIKSYKRVIVFGQAALLALPSLPILAQDGDSGWQPWQLLTITVLGVVAVIVGVDQLRVHASRARNRRLEELVAERTAEAGAKQKKLEQQNKRLEVNNTIVKFINARIGFSDLLQTILEGIIFALSADRALALVRRANEDAFVVAAASGWRFGDPKDLVMNKADIEESYLAEAEILTPGIWLGGVGEAPLTAAERTLGGISKAVLVMRVEVDDEVAGYLIVSDVRHGDAFDDHELGAFEDLREHMASAFIKGKMMEELRQLNQAKNEFLGIAAHDLRSPLGGILGYTELLQRFLQEERQDKDLWYRFLANIHVIARDMRELVNQLLDVTAIESGNVDLHVKPEKLSDLLYNRFDLYQRTADEKGIRLTCDFDSDIEVPCDRLRIGEALDNLISNAIKFTWPGGEIQLCCEVDDDEAVIRVEDNGQGLADYELGEVFSGKRLSARPTAGESSTGLGLVIVRKLIEMHGGRVWVNSQKGEGSAFCFALPREVPAASEDENSDAENP